MLQSLKQVYQNLFFLLSCGAYDFERAPVSIPQALKQLDGMTDNLEKLVETLRRTVSNHQDELLGARSLRGQLKKVDLRARYERYMFALKRYERYQSLLTNVMRQRDMVADAPITDAVLEAFNTGRRVTEMHALRAARLMHVVDDIDEMTAAVFDPALDSRDLHDVEEELNRLSDESIEERLLSLESLPPAPTQVPERPAQQTMLYPAQPELS